MHAFRFLINYYYELLLFMVFGAMNFPLAPCIVSTFWQIYHYAYIHSIH